MATEMQAQDLQKQSAHSINASPGTQNSKSRPGLLADMQNPLERNIGFVLYYALYYGYIYICAGLFAWPAI
jgi:hypothetical protein